MCFKQLHDDDDIHQRFYCAMTGDFVIRIAHDSCSGNLLMSAGDGTIQNRKMTTLFVLKLLLKLQALLFPKLNRWQLLCPLCSYGRIMSTIKVNKIENTSTTDGGISIDNSGHVTVDGQQLPSAGALSNRNLVINGAMNVWQRGQALCTNLR